MIPYSNETTSKDAARSLDTARVTGLNLRVLERILAHGFAGACNHELEAEMQLDGNTLRPRVWTLRKLGLIVDSGLTRLTPSGRRAIVWVAA